MQIRAQTSWLDLHAGTLIVSTEERFPKGVYLLVSVAHSENGKKKQRWLADNGDLIETHPDDVCVPDYYNVYE